MCPQNMGLWVFLLLHFDMNICKGNFYIDKSARLRYNYRRGGETFG